MYATVRHYEGIPVPSEVVRRMNEYFVPMIREIEGFVDYQFNRCRDGEMVSISNFEDRSGEEESNWRAGEFVGEHLAPLFNNPPHITAGEVVAHTAK